jgi:hypothetical protein
LKAYYHSPVACIAMAIRTWSFLVEIECRYIAAST